VAPNDDNVEVDLEDAVPEELESDDVEVAGDDLDDVEPDEGFGDGDLNSSNEDDGDDKAAEEAAEALEELEAEELELLEDEAAETLLVDEAAELRAIRRAELTLDADAEEIRGDEFVCSSCFLVKRISQLADKRKLICKDCAG